MCLNPLTIRGLPYLVSCGKCVECKINYSNEWALRVMLEASLHQENCFITLTYNEDNLPVGETLRKRDLQLFMKRLRKRLSADAIKVRFFACGEYGSLHGRPHYHIILFGYAPKDLQFFKTDNKGNKIYRSPMIEKLWKFGFSSVGNLTFDSAKYCAKYLQKHQTDSKKIQPFLQMSRKPGIGFGYLDKLSFENIKDNAIYLLGKKYKLPKAFKTKLKENPILENLFETVTTSDIMRSSKIWCKYSNEFVDDLSDFHLKFLQYQEDLSYRQKKFRLKFKNNLDKFYRLC